MKIGDVTVGVEYAANSMWKTNRGLAATHTLRRVRAVEIVTETEGRLYSTPRNVRKVRVEFLDPAPVDQGGWCGGFRNQREGSFGVVSAARLIGPWAAVSAEHAHLQSLAKDGEMLRERINAKLIAFGIEGVRATSWGGRPLRIEIDGEDLDRLLTLALSAPVQEEVAS